MYLLDDGNPYVCTGIVVQSGPADRTIVLTAAHCVYEYRPVSARRQRTRTGSDVSSWTVKLELSMHSARLQRWWVEWRGLAPCDVSDGDVVCRSSARRATPTRWATGTVLFPCARLKSRERMSSWFLLFPVLSRGFTGRRREHEEGGPRDASAGGRGSSRSAYACVFP